MRGIASERTNRYTPVPQCYSDEDEGVYDESPDSFMGGPQLLPERSDVTYGGFVDHSSIGVTSLSSSDDLRSHFRMDDINAKTHDEKTLPEFVTMGGGQKRMSTARRCVFVASLLACVAYVVAMLWLIPCEVGPCLTSSKNSVRLSSWKSSFHNITIKAEPQIVNLTGSRMAVILASYSTVSENIVAADFQNLLAVDASTGKEIWREFFFANISGIACLDIDVNRDLYPDCLIYGEMGLMSAINISNGKSFWYIHNHKEKLRLNEIYAPCILEDWDNDHVKEIALIGRSKTGTAQLFVVSGLDGQVVGHPLVLPSCEGNLDLVRLSKLKGSSAISFVCNRKEENEMVVFVAEMEDIQAATFPRDEGPQKLFQEVFRFAMNSIIQAEDLDRDGNTDLLVRSDDGLAMLSGAQQYRCLWKKTFSSSKIIGKLVTGFYNHDSSLDVVVTLLTKNCGSQCRTQVYILDGIKGDEVGTVLFPCRISTPMVLEWSGQNTNLFVVKQANIPAMYNYTDANAGEHKSNSSAFVLSKVDDATQDINKNDVWKIINQMEKSPNSSSDRSLAQGNTSLEKVLKMLKQSQNQSIISNQDVPFLSIYGFVCGGSLLSPIEWPTSQEGTCYGEIGWITRGNKYYILSSTVSSSSMELLLEMVNLKGGQNVTQHMDSHLKMPYTQTCIH